MIDVDLFRFAGIFSCDYLDKENSDLFAFLFSVMDGKL